MVCPKNEGDEIYIMGNPPFLGKSMQSISQKEDMSIVFKGVNGYGNLDYVTCWYKKSSDFMEDTPFQAAFVSTNSISQGIAVPPLWSYLFNRGIVINFAYTTFQWVNSAKQNAGVYCIIVGISFVERKIKQIFSGSSIINTKSINAYLLPSSNIIVESRLKPLSSFPEMQVGSCPADGGHLILTENEYQNLILTNPVCSKFIRPYMGSDELIKGKKRFCFWFKGYDKSLFISIPEIKGRLEKVKSFREQSTKIPTRKKAITPYFFTEERYSDGDFILIPMVSSEKRKFVPIGFCKEDIIPSNLASFIPNSSPYIFSILNSSMVMTWVRTVGGKLEERLRFSASTVYNTFPFPSISHQRAEELTQCTFRILEEREKHPEKTLAQLYDPNKMPDGLREAHRLNDEAVERCYRSTPFNSDEERLEYLFKLYEKMIQEEKEKGTLFEAEKKTRKKQ